jgi:hypothetical protein
MSDFIDLSRDYDGLYRCSPELLELRQQLAALPLLHGISFCASCCERLYPQYRLVVSAIGVPDVMRSIVDGVWFHVCGRTLDRQTIDEYMQICWDAPLGGEDADRPYWEATAAIDSLLHTLNACKTGSIDDMVSAVDCVRNIAFQQSKTAIMGQDYGPLDHTDIASLHHRIQQHPIFAQELERELRQLHFLAASASLDPAVLSTLRDL